MCEHRGPNGGDLKCDNPDPHDENADTGHTYTHLTDKPHLEGGKQR